MASDTVIHVEDLSKRYLLGQGGSKGDGLRHAIEGVVSAPFRWAARLGRSVTVKASTAENREFWALRDVNLRVNTGDVVGIIGRNGAGKSTMLKLLSRITEPTEGRIRMRGRVASLLEVGTGFHPELTGRENIFLNGAILGMSRVDIKLRFDEIVAFAEVDRFLDTPVKRYSSGMYVRLAFAVAAHLEPDVLIVDEVLAVGDASFQKKCMGKMGDSAKNGRTILFVSHNMAAVEHLCNRGVVLNSGRVTFDGSQGDAVRHYLSGTKVEGGSLSRRKDRQGNGRVIITGVEIKDADSTLLDVAACGQSIDFFIHYEAQDHFSSDRLNVSIQCLTDSNTPVFMLHNQMTGQSLPTTAGRGSFVCRIPKLPLVPSGYRFNLCIMQDGEYVDELLDAFELTVVDGNFYGTGEVPPSTHGIFLTEASWRKAAAYGV